MAFAPQVPCTACVYKDDCAAFSELDTALFGSPRYVRPRALDAVDLALDVLVESFVVGLRDPRSRSWVRRQDAGVYFAALFDLAVNGLYVSGLVDVAGSYTQRALGCGPDVAYFPFVWMCPGCVASGHPLEGCYLPEARREESRDYPRQELLAKPGGRAIGDAGIKVLLAIFRYTLAITRPSAILREGGGTHGEFDLTTSDPAMLLFAEVKAKPLVAYPLRLAMDTGLASGEHKWLSLDSGRECQASLFLAASGVSLPLSPPAGEPEWPLPDLARAVADPATLRAVVGNWTLHLEGYRQWEGEDRRTRWHRFGCGNFSVGSGAGRIEKRVANTKELPGLDRTDDIKKGAAQLLKFSRFKFECRAHRLRTVLIGNTFAETHSDDYISPLVRLRITRADDPQEGAEWIFDAVVGLTQNRFNAQELAEVFDFERVLDEA